MKKMSLLFKRHKAFSAAMISILIFLAFGPGCGYHFRTTGKPVGLRIQGLAIPLMASTSSSLGFEGVFTKIVRDEFVSHSKVPLVSRETATAVLLGEVSEIRVEPLTYSLTQNTVNGKVTNYEVTNTRRLRIKLSASLVESASGKVIWADKELEEKGTFSVGTDPLVNRYNEKKAVREIAQSLARRLYQKTMERF